VIHNFLQRIPRTRRREELARDVGRATCWCGDNVRVCRRHWGHGTDGWDWGCQTITDWGAVAMSVSCTSSCCRHGRRRVHGCIVARIRMIAFHPRMGDAGRYTHPTIEGPSICFVISMGVCTRSRLDRWCRRHRRLGKTSHRASESFCYWERSDWKRWYWFRLFPLDSFQPILRRLAVESKEGQSFCWFWGRSRWRSWWGNGTRRTRSTIFRHGFDGRRCRGRGF
jgi:hypothetical protein